jgi:hypothetical protein
VFFGALTIIGFGIHYNMPDSFHSGLLAGIASPLPDFNFQYLSLSDFKSSLLQINRFY